MKKCLLTPLLLFTCYAQLLSPVVEGKEVIAANDNEEKEPLPAYCKDKEQVSDLKCSALKMYLSSS